MATPASHALDLAHVEDGRRASLLAPLRAFSRRQWLAALGATGGALLVLGVPTAIVPNPVFGRIIPTTALDVVVWLISSFLLGLLVATYAPGMRLDVGERAPGGRIGAAGIVTYLAIGCPICNKLLLLVLGTSGTLQLFAPLQPLLGVLAITGLVVSLWLRLRQLARRSACPLPGRV